MLYDPRHIPQEIIDRFWSSCFGSEVKSRIDRFPVDLAPAGIPQGKKVA